MPRPLPSITCRPLDTHRLIVNDIVWLARDTPVFPCERVFDLAVLERLRRSCGRRIGWAAIFMKAYALVAREMPVLRSWYVPASRLAPWRGPRMATSSESVASLSINRGDDGGDALYWARFRAPDRMPLAELQDAIAEHQTGAVEEVFKRQRELGLLPRWLRRLVLQWNRDSPGEKHATRLGTFSISTLAGAGAFNRMHPSPLTTSLTYGPLDATGHCLVTLLCDHRLIDGMPAARALGHLEEVLRADISAELESICLRDRVEEGR